MCFEHYHSVTIHQSTAHKLLQCILQQRMWTNMGSTTGNRCQAGRRLGYIRVHKTLNKTHSTRMDAAHFFRTAELHHVLSCRFSLLGLDISLFSIRKRKWGFPTLELMIILTGSNMAHLDIKDRGRCCIRYWWLCYEAVFMLLSDSRKRNIGDHFDIIY